MFEKMYQRGLRVVVAAHEGAWVSALVSSGTVELLVTVPGLWTAPQTEELATHVVQKISCSGVARIDAVFNVYYHYLLLSARIASRLGCITNAPDAVETCIVKSKGRACLTSAGLEDWQSYSFRTMDELKRVAGIVEYPAVLKPTDSSGSYGVVKVFSPRDATVQFLALKAESWFQSDETEFILEEYIDGPEFGVEIVMQDGKVLFSSVMDASKQKDSIFFQGTGRSCPSSQPPSIQESTVDHCCAAVKALGLTTGVLDIDVRYSRAHGPRVLEVNPRMGGGSVDVMHRLAHGIDLVHLGLSIFLGIGVADEVAARESCPAKCFEAGWLMSPRSGVIQNISLFTERLKAKFRGEACVMSISALREDGAEVIGTNAGLPTCLIEVVTSGASKSLALEHLDMVLSSAEGSIGDLVRAPESTMPAKAIDATGSHALPLAAHVSADGEIEEEDSDCETVATQTDIRGQVTESFV